MFVCSFYRAVIIITFTRWQVYLYNYENLHKKEKRSESRTREEMDRVRERNSQKFHWQLSPPRSLIHISPVHRSDYEYMNICKLISDIFDVALLTSNTNQWNVWTAKSIYFYFYIYLIGQISINKLTKSIMFNLSQHHHKNSSENFAHFSFFLGHPQKFR